MRDTRKQLRDSDRAKIDARPSVGSLNRQALRDETQWTAPACHRLLHLKVHHARPSLAT